MTLLEKAIILSTKAHAGQKDKSGEAYILHPLFVMSKMKNDMGRIVALLHDVIEDTEITEDDLRKEGFPSEVIDTVKILTRSKNEDYIEDYIQRILTNSLAIEVKLGDLSHNMDLNRMPNPSEHDFQRLEKYKKAEIMLKNGICKGM